jgi:hypothetical protein
MINPIFSFRLPHNFLEEVSMSTYTCLVEGVLLWTHEWKITLNSLWVELIYSVNQCVEPRIHSWYLKQFSYPNQALKTEQILKLIDQYVCLNYSSNYLQNTSSIFWKWITFTKINHLTANNGSAIIEVPLHPSVKLQVTQKKQEIALAVCFDIKLARRVHW